MKKSFLLTVFSVLFFLLAAVDVEACRCFRSLLGDKGLQTCGDYWSAESVFVGVAEKIEIDNNSSSMKVTFSVEKPIRGTNGKTIEVFTNAMPSMCGYPFKQGERYFVYGRKGQDGKLTESLCGPTVLLKDAKNDLEYAKEIADGNLGTRFSGTVVEDRQGVEYDHLNNKPLPDIEITIKSARNTYKTRTDENGIYVFRDFPKDFYRVSAALPDGVREINPQQDRLPQFANPCAVKLFGVTRKGSIRGRVVGFPTAEIENVGDRQPAQPQLTLIPLDNQGDPISASSSFRQAWAYRNKFEYAFENTSSGKYLVAMNPNNCAYPNNGVPPTYYPGLATRGEAQVVTIKDGEHLVLDDFRSLPLLKERWIVGRVIGPDGTPVAKATVRLTNGELGRSTCSDGRWEVATDDSGKFRLKGYLGYGYSINAYVVGPDGKIQASSKLLSLQDETSTERLELVLSQSF